MGPWDINSMVVKVVLAKNQPELSICIVAGSARLIQKGKLYMLDHSGFDLWADGYDQSVELSEKSNLYPFAAYKDVLNEVYRIVRQTSSHGRILELGFGTGILTKKLYDDGYLITGVDFSNKMIELTKKKTLHANLIQSDFSDGLPKELAGMRFDFIISTYAIHHLNDRQKISLIAQMKNALNSDGCIVFGDVMTNTAEEMAHAQARDHGLWDEEEYYLIADDVRAWFPECKLSFSAKSYCSGVLTITR